MRIANCSTSTCVPGSDAFSRIWSRRKRRISIAGSAGSDACSLKSKWRPSRCLLERPKEETGIRKETAMKHEDKAAVGRREFLRTVGAGAGLAATAAVPLTATANAAESADERKKSRYRETDH